MAVPVVAVAAGVEILSAIAKIATTDEGVAWIGRRLKDKLPALRALIKAHQKVKVAGKLPGA